MAFIAPTFSASDMATICSKTGSGGGGWPNVGTISVLPNETWELKKRDILNSVPLVPRDIDTRADASRTYVFEPAVQRVFELNRTGGRLLALVDGRRSVQEISDHYFAEDPDSPADLARLVAAFFNGLQIAGFNLMFARNSE